MTGRETLTCVWIHGLWNESAIVDWESKSGVYGCDLQMNCSEIAEAMMGRESVTCAGMGGLYCHCYHHSVHVSEKRVMGSEIGSEMGSEIESCIQRDDR